MQHRASRIAAHTVVRYELVAPVPPTSVGAGAALPRRRHAEHVADVAVDQFDAEDAQPSRVETLRRVEHQPVTLPRLHLQPQQARP